MKKLTTERTKMMETKLSFKMVLLFVFGCIQALGMVPASADDNRNYIYTYFTDGRYNDRDSNVTFQTGYYSFALNSYNMEIVGYDAFEGEDYESALTQDVTQFTPARFTIQAYVGNRRYTCTGSTVTNGGIDLVETGQYLKRVSISLLQFKDDAGESLSYVNSSGSTVTDLGLLNIAAWPEHMNFKLDLSDVGNVTRTVIEIISPNGQVHRTDSASDVARLAVSPHTDRTYADVDPSDYVLEAVNVSTSTSVDLSFDDDFAAIEISLANDNGPWRIKLTNPTREAKNVPLFMPSQSKVGVVHLLQELDGRPIGIPIQASKNWHGSRDGSPNSIIGSWSRAALVLSMSAGETKEFLITRYTNYYADGAFPSASHSSLCLVGANSTNDWKWDNASLGNWAESITYNPGKDYTARAIPDIRPQFITVDNIYELETWTENVGAATWMLYNDEDNVSQTLPLEQKTCYLWAGPNLTKVKFSAYTLDRKMRYIITAEMGTTNDYFRSTFTYKTEILKDISPTSIVFMQVGSEDKSNPDYINYHFGDANGLIQSVTPDQSISGFDESAKFSFNDRWLVMGDYEKDLGVRSRRTLIHKSSTLNGNDFPVSMYPTGSNGKTIFSLSSAELDRSYSAGDVIETEVQFCLPLAAEDIYWGADEEYRARLASYGANEWMGSYDEYRYNRDIDVTVTAGTKLRNYPLEIDAASGAVIAEAVITSGGVGHIPVVVNNVPTGGYITLQYLNDNTWEAIPEFNVEAHNYYQGYKNVDGQIDYAFTVRRVSTDISKPFQIRVVRSSEVVGLRDTKLLAAFDFDAGAADPKAPNLVASNLTVSPVSGIMTDFVVDDAGDTSGVDARGEAFGDTETLGCLGMSVVSATANLSEDAVAEGNYMEFTVTPAEGKMFSLSSISFKASTQLATGVDKYTVADDQGNEIGRAYVTRGGVSNGAYDSLKIDLTGSEYDSISEATTFRIYAWGRTLPYPRFVLAFFDKLTLHGKEVSGLVAHWEMNEGSGNVVTDSSGLRFDGLASNTLWSPGKTGESLTFGGVDSSVGLPAAAFDFIEDEVTISMWIFGADTQPVADSVLQANNESNRRVLNILLPHSDGNVYWDAGNDGTASFDRVYQRADAAQYSGKWNHWAFTKNATTGIMKMYVNGKIFSEGTGLTNPMAGITTVSLGRWINGIKSYNGRIDDVRLYNTALSDEEVAGVYFNDEVRNYSSWLNYYAESSGDEDLINGNVGLANDADRDGIATLLEYVLNGDPLAVDTQIGPQPSMNGDDLVFTFDRLAASDTDTEQVFQYGSDLHGWTDMSISNAADGSVVLGTAVNGIQSVTITIPNAGTSEKRMFGRLKVTQ